MLLAQPGWTWPLASDTPGGQQVPSVVNLDVATAQAQLTAAGFKSTVLLTPCGSKVTPGDVAYYSPKIADPATTTVNLCVSSGVPPYVAAPVVKPSSSASNRPGSSSASNPNTSSNHSSAPSATTRHTTGNGGGNGNGH
jgi:hypothetical protein